MTRRLLDDIRIASPCAARWEDMEGDDRARRCEECRLTVFDVSALSGAEAERFLRERAAAGGRTCVRLYRRADGTILTRDCPVGLARVRRRLARSLVAAAALLTAALAAFGIGDALTRGQISHGRRFHALYHALNPWCGRCRGELLGEVVLPPAEMGDVAWPSDPPTTGE